MFNPDSGLTKSLTQEQTYTQRAGCTVNPGNGTWLVKGRDTTHGIDADADGQETGEDTVLLAGEELPGDGKVYVSGGLFLEDERHEGAGQCLEEPSAETRVLWKRC